MKNSNSKSDSRRQFIKNISTSGIIAVSGIGLSALASCKDPNQEKTTVLTTDGKLSDTVNRFGIEKEYFAQLDGEITEEAIKQLRLGVEIGFEGKKYQTKTQGTRSIKPSEV